MCKTCEWQKVRTRIEDGLALADELSEGALGSRGPFIDFADGISGKLRSIKEWVKKAKHVTEKQAQAVEGMIAGLEKWER